MSWLQAEDSFLKLYCKIEEFPWGRRYSWADGQDWPKFNFVRLLDGNLTEEQFVKLASESRDFFKGLNKTLSVKLSSSVFSTVPDFLKDYRLAGTPLLSLKLPMLDTVEGIPQDVEFSVCETEADLVDFVRVNSDGRDFPLDSPIYKMVANVSKHPSTEFYLLRYLGEPVACGATVVFGESYNLWGLATRSSFQRRGYMHLLTSQINQKLKRHYYVQVNEGEGSHKYFASLKNAQLCNVETRYIPIS